MCQEKYTTTRKKGKHLTIEEKYKLEVLLKAKKTKKEIAELLDVSERTIYREIKRGKVELLNSDYTYRKEYSAQLSQSKYRKNLQGYLKIGKNIKLANHIENLIIHKKFSPAAAIYQSIKDGYEVNFSTKTLYNYINNEIFEKLNRSHLPVSKFKRRKTKTEKVIRLKDKKSIEQREEKINKREEFGHWEIDTVIGKRNSSECLLVLTERVSRIEIIRRLKSKTAVEVVRALNKLYSENLWTFKEYFKTITADNGSEFCDAEGIESIGVELFYAHSYCSYERGSNENANKLIRRFIPKGSEIENYSDEYIKEIESWMNNYPRKIFNGLSAKEVFSMSLNFS